MGEMNIFDELALAASKMDPIEYTSGYCLCLNKVRDKNGKILKYTVKFEDGKVLDADPILLKNRIKSKEIFVYNLTITSDGRLIDRDFEAEKKRLLAKYNKWLTKLSEATNEILHTKTTPLNFINILMDIPYTITSVGSCGNFGLEYKNDVIYARDYCDSYNDMYLSIDSDINEDGHDSIIRTTNLFSDTGIKMYISFLHGAVYETFGDAIETIDEKDTESDADRGKPARLNNKYNLLFERVFSTLRNKIDPNKSRDIRIIIDDELKYIDIIDGSGYLLGYDGPDVTLYIDSLMTVYTVDRSKLSKLYSEFKIKRGESNDSAYLNSINLDTIVGRPLSVSNTIVVSVNKEIENFTRGIVSRFPEFEFIPSGIGHIPMEDIPYDSIILIKYTDNNMTEILAKMCKLIENIDLAYRKYKSGKKRSNFLDNIL